MSGSNFAYAATRARVRRSKLLQAEAYRHLMAMEVVEITRYITELDYREDVDKYAAAFKGLDLIEVALASNLRRSSATILSFCKGQLRELVSQYLERYRIHDLKRVIRGIYSNIDPDEILRGMFTTDAKDREFFSRLAAAATLAELADLLDGTPYHSLLAGLLVKELSTLQEVEDALDRFYYQRLLESVDPSTRANQLLLEFLKQEIDVINLKTLLRLRHLGHGGYSELLIPGGAELTVDQLAATTSVDDVASILEGSEIGKAVTDELAAVPAEGLHHVSATLNHYLAQQARRLTRLYPLSVLPILDYLLHKEYEVANLRALARGKELGLPKEDIEELLVVV